MILNVDFPTEELRRDYRLTADELETVLRRASRDAALRLRTVGRRELRRQEPGMSAGSAANRVRTRQVGGQWDVWFGGDPLAARLQLRRVRQLARRRGRGGRAVSIDGAVIPGAFIWQANRLGLVLQRTRPGRGGLNNVKIPLDRAVRRAYAKTEQEAEPIVDSIVIARAQGVVRGRRV